MLDNIGTDSPIFTQPYGANGSIITPRRAPELPEKQMNAYLDAMRRYVDFRGRSTPAQFWLFVLIFSVLVVLAIILDVAVLGADPDKVLPLTAIVAVSHYIPALAVTVRRLHDSDHSGWLVLVGLIPLIGQIALLVFTFLGSTQGPNKFGPYPGSRPLPAGTAGVPAAQVSSSGDVEQLAKLAELKNSGAIDEAEYSRLKERLLGAGNT